MSVSIQILGKYDKKNLKVEVKQDKDKPSKFYKVPTEQLDGFTKNYQKNERKCSIISNTAFAGFLLAGVLCTSALFSKMSNKIIKFVLCSSGGVLGAFSSIFLSSKYINKSNEKLLQKFSVEELPLKNQA